MCGHARLSSDVSEIKLASSIPPERPTPNVAPSWNVAPTDRLPIVHYDVKERARHLEVMRWGLSAAAPSAFNSSHLRLLPCVPPRGRVAQQPPFGKKITRSTAAQFAISAPVTTVLFYPGSHGRLTLRITRKVIGSDVAGSAAIYHHEQNHQPQPPGCKIHFGRRSYI